MRQPRLDRRFLIGADHELARMQQLALPSSLVEIEYRPCPLQEGRVGREDPGAVLPRLERVLGQPAGDRRGRRHANATLDHEPVQLSGEKRESGTPCVRGNSQAIAFTWATCSGGKTAGTARALPIVEPRQPLLEEALPPAPDHLRRRLQPARNLGVAQPLGGVQDHFRSLHHLERQRVAGHPPLKLRPLLATQHDLEGTLRHGILFDANRPVPSTDHDRTSGREH
jgi:hypothetical protein